jgi:DNA-binding NarL/FixJ family response regulator
MSPNQLHQIAIVDDHLLFAESLTKLINTFDDFNVCYHAKNGVQLQQTLKASEVSPDIILLDINMPVMNGYDTAKWLQEEHPNIRVLALSMEDEESAVLKMLHNGAKGYLLKDIHPKRLETALCETMEKGFYHSDRVSVALIHALKNGDEDDKVQFKKNELIFLRLACSEKTYKEIADEMNLSPKTIDGYRQDLFQKLNIKNRVGLVLYAIEHKLFTI